MRRLALLLLPMLALAAASCGGDILSASPEDVAVDAATPAPEDPASGRDAAGGLGGDRDAAGGDDGSVGGEPADAAVRDAGTDAGAPGAADAGASDGGNADAAGADGGPADSGSGDAGNCDAGTQDAGRVDAGGTDAGSADGSSMDDAGAPDAGAQDASSSDAGEDAGVADAAGGDAGSSDDASASVFARRPFNAASPYNTPIPANPRIDPEPSRGASLNAGAVNLSLYWWTTRIYEVDGTSEPRVPVDCTRSWGTCELESEPGGVPIPAGAVGAYEADGHMVIWDVANQISYDFWGYRYPNNTGAEGRTEWGGVVSTAGNGVDDPGGRLAAGGATGSNIARLAGLIRVHEVKAGLIPHALVGATSNSCNTLRWPALKTDGWSTHADCIPEGARIQLDPSIDLDTVTELGPIDRMVAEALQRYGWYNIDNGGAFTAGATKWSIQLEIDPEATGPDCPALGRTYCDAGVRSEYHQLRGRLPDGSRLSSHMRVLAAWDGR